jgi:VIT1/CCC1 family predicted Fe2+/Mn2+ transporter
VTAIRRTPNAQVSFASAFVLQIGRTATRNPLVQSAWMFFADMLAASVPVLPFAFLPLGEARAVSIAVTTVLLLLLALGRGVVARTNVFWTMLETVLIAATAAGAGQLITHWAAGG